MATTTITPVKLKAFLANIKESFLDDDKTTIDVSILFLALLRMELLQRGVLLDDDGKVDTVITSVQSTAGKALLISSTSSTIIPPPLLAGSSVIAGRIAEQLAITIIRSQSTTTINLLGNDNNVKLSDLKTTIKRCQDVDDDRLYIILNIAINTAKTDIKTIINTIYVIAEGYFLRAASIQGNNSPPMMWKKAWDCITARNNNNNICWESITSVTNLLRIAKNKGNQTRVIELLLILTDCYLDGIDNNNKAISPKDEINKIYKVFLSEYRPIQPDNDYHAIITKAMETLDEINNENDLSEEDKLYYTLLKYRTLIKQQDIQIQNNAEQEYNRLKNRVNAGSKKNSTTKTTTTTTTGTKPISLESCIDKARRIELADNDDDRVEILSNAIKLWNILVAITTPSNSDKHIMVYQLLSQHITWLQNSAQAMMIKKNNNIQGWNDYAIFVKGILKFWHNNSEKDKSFDINISDEISNFVENVCIAIPSIEWMCCNNNNNNGSKYNDNGFVFTIQNFENVIRILTDLIQRRTQIQEKDENKSIVKTTESSVDSILVKLLHARDSIRAIIYLYQTDGGNTDNKTLADIAENATTRSSSSDGCSEFGLAFFEFLVCWSGFHKIPWPFSSQPDARTLVKRARTCLMEAKSIWGRQTSKLEEIIVALGSADAEGPSFDGGLMEEARNGYEKILEDIENNSGITNDIIAARCYFGLAKLKLREVNESIDGQAIELFARKSLKRLQLIPSEHNESISLWHSPQFSKFVIQFQIAISRQLIADILLRSGDAASAQGLLEDAVVDAPEDSTASFALGTFRLYNVFFGNSRATPESEKAAQVQLLRAAKLDSSKAGPFALLGYWYEYRKDFKRAIGCYSKALLLEPSHPVAGRGVLRLAPQESLGLVFEKAMETSSSVVGWAWSAIGKQKAMEDGEDEMAVVAFLKALRCRDLERPETEQLAAFFDNPMQPSLPSKLEFCRVLYELGACYRRLGRFTASIRTFRTAIQSAGESVWSSLLCSCAQVELELGLLDEAEDRFGMALALDDELQAVAAYGRSIALLSKAHRDNQDGKAGSAYHSIQEAIGFCSRVDSMNTVCARKLVGDLYSFGASLPPDVFSDPGSDFSDTSVQQISRSLQLQFLAKGHEAFHDAKNLVVGETEESNALRASLLTDAGSNLLLRAQLRATWDGQGIQYEKLETAKDLFEESSNEFRRALELCPTLAPAWCGLGCSVVNSDPLLSQHAFCRALELDNLSPDPYANLSFLYTSHSKFSTSSLVSDALTEVADTPMMWINRAFILENKAACNPGSDDSRESICQASDAYRAALQVVKHPRAMLGLTLSCQMTLSNAPKCDPNLVYESQNNSSEYLWLCGRTDLPILALNGIFQMEAAVLEASSTQGENWIAEGRLQVFEAVEQMKCLKDSNAHIDLNLFQQACADPEKNVEGKVMNETLDLDEHRKVILEPNRGDLWLNLAKKLLLSHNSSSEPALIAAQRSASLLQQNLSGNLAIPPSYNDAYVKADELSDALALRYWLESLTLEYDKDDEKKESENHANSVDLQMALLICPGNAMAREALRTHCARHDEF